MFLFSFLGITLGVLALLFCILLLWIDAVIALQICFPALTLIASCWVLLEIYNERHTAGPTHQDTASKSDEERSPAQEAACLCASCPNVTCPRRGCSVSCQNQ